MKERLDPEKLSRRDLVVDSSDAQLEHYKQNMTPRNFDIGNAGCSTLPQ